MRDTVKHCCLHYCVMNHILKNQLIAHFKWSIKRPITHIIAAQATITPDSVCRFAGLASVANLIFGL